MDSEFKMVRDVYAERLLSLTKAMLIIEAELQKVLDGIDAKIDDVLQSVGELRHKYWDWSEVVFRNGEAIELLNIKFDILTQLRNQLTGESDE
jgi:hypothetical protein